MEPLTDTTPKPLLSVGGKTIIDHNIEILQQIVDEIIIVTGYKKEKFYEHFSDRKIKLVEQDKALGTAHAALQAKDHIENEAIILNGDDLYDKSIEKLSKFKYAIQGYSHQKPSNYGVLEHKNGKISSLKEKPENPSSKLVNTGCYKVDKKFFDILQNVEKSERGEYEITDGIKTLLKQEETVNYVESEFWQPCGYPWQLIEANKKLLAKTTENILSPIPKDAEIIGPVRIEEDVKIHNNTVIEGPAIIKKNSEIGPNAYIRESVIYENVKIGNSSEVKNSIICKNSKAPHLNYIGDSYIGKNVNLGAGAKTANLRNDEKEIKMKNNGKILKTGLRKLGAIIGDNTKIGVNSVTQPGAKIGANCIADSLEKIQNLPSQSMIKNGEIYEDWNRL